MSDAIAESETSSALGFHGNQTSEWEGIFLGHWTYILRFLCCGSRVRETYSRQAFGLPLCYAVSNPLELNARYRVDVRCTLAYNVRHTHGKYPNYAGSDDARKKTSVLARESNDCPLEHR